MSKLTKIIQQKNSDNNQIDLENLYVPGIKDVSDYAKPGTFKSTTGFIAELAVESKHSNKFQQLLNQIIFHQNEVNDVKIKLYVPVNMFKPEPKLFSNIEDQFEKMKFDTEQEQDLTLDPITVPVYYGFTDLNKAKKNINLLNYFLSKHDQPIEAVPMKLTEVLDVNKQVILVKKINEDSENLLNEMMKNV